MYDDTAYELKIRVEYEDDMDLILDVLDDMDSDNLFLGGIAVRTTSITDQKIFGDTK